MNPTTPELPDETCAYVLRKKTRQRPRYGQCSPLYMEKVKKWKHHFRDIVHKVFMNADTVSVPINFAPMSQYLNGFLFEYYPFNPTEHGLNIDGMYDIVDEGTIRIFVANDVPRERQRFTIAHEFAHILQRFDGEFMADMEAIADPVERQNIIERVAEITASYYLAPYPVLKRAYARAIEHDDRWVIRSLATEFAVSVKMMEICVSDYSLQKQ